MFETLQDYMLDTNVFNDVCDGKISLAAFDGRRVHIIEVQAAELRATANIKRRTDLLRTLDEISPVSLLASSAVFDIEGAGWGQARWNDGTGTFEKMLARLKELDGRSGKRARDDKNQTRDIIIAETAINNKAILVSRDANLRQVVLDFGGSAVTLPGE